MVMSVGNTAGRSWLIEFNCTDLTTVLHCYDAVEWLIKANPSCLVHGLSVISFARVFWKAGGCASYENIMHYHLPFA